MTQYRIAVLVGSLRQDSLNGKLATALGRLAPPALSFQRTEIGDLPPYNQDEEASPPPTVTRLKDEIAAAQGVLFVTPEYNRSIPGVLKNAIDHASRPYGQSAWAGKPAGVVGVSVGAAGTAMAQQHLRNVLAYLDMPTLGHLELNMAGIEVRCFEQPNGTIAETLWREGMQEHHDNGTVALAVTTTAPTAIPPGAIAWVALVEGVPAAVQVSRFHLAATTAEGMLTYVRPSYRGQRLYSRIQSVMDADLLERGITHAVFAMPDTATADRLATAVLARGGEHVGEDDVALRTGLTRRRHFRRALSAGATT